MRLKLLLSFTVIILITISSVVLILRQNAVNEVRQFMFRGGMMGLNPVVVGLENCYRDTLSWENCDGILENAGHHSNMPGGMMGGRMEGNAPPAGQEDLLLLDEEGTVLADTRPGSPMTGTSVSSLEGAIPLQNRGEVVGYLQTDTPFVFNPQNESALINRINRAALTAAAISGAAALVLAFYLGTRLLQPVQALTDGAKKVQQGELDHRVRIDGSGELATLGRVFNQMVSSIQHSAERRKALTADIAHELRTPLSVQQAHLEALEDDIYELTKENLRPIRDQNRILTRLVEDLRTLSLAEAGELNLERTETDFKELVERMIQRFQPKINKKGLSVRTTFPEKSLKPHIDPQRVEQIIMNLLSNAIRYSPHGGVVDVGLFDKNDNVVFTVRDQGEGIPEDEIPFIFERFYKSSTSRHDEDSGTGLGLSISQKLAQAQGGSLEARNHPQGGAVFTLTLPIDHP